MKVAGVPFVIDSHARCLNEVARFLKIQI